MSSTIQAGSIARSRDVLSWALSATIVFGVGFYLYASLHSQIFRYEIDTAESHPWVRLLTYPSVLWSVMATVLLTFRTALWVRYRPFPSLPLDEAPSLTVIIPAYNEGPMVLKSIESVISARYPRDKLEVFVVDDGSKDDTWLHIQTAASRYTDAVTALRFDQNRGKRAALGVGFQRARGDFVVTLDSDSVIDRDALLAIVAPFRNPRVGAVAGKVTVYNRREGLIPRMLHVRYLLAFDLLRAVESSYGTVYCCPGALTAYRTSAVRKVLPRWLTQTFLGVACTYGEDRALTNDLLAEGFDSVYQGTAEVKTVVPTTYRKLAKMFLRWNRSYVREEMRFMKIVWTRRPVARVIAIFDRLITNLRYPVSYLSLALLATLAVATPFVLLRFLAVVGLMSLLNMLYYLRSELSADFFYGILFSYFSLFALSWIFPYAFFTVKARSWLTR